MVDSVTNTIRNGTLTLSSNTITTGASMNMVLGTTSAPASLEINGYPVDESPTCSLNSALALPGSTGTVLQLNAYRTSLSSPTEIQAGDTFSSIRWQGYQRFTGEATPSIKPLAAIQSTLMVAGDGASIEPSAKLTVFLSDGATFGNATTFDFTKDQGLVGNIFRARPFATVAARNAAITSPLAGMVVFLTDDGSLGGSPAVPKLQVYTGAAWVNLH